MYFWCPKKNISIFEDFGSLLPARPTAVETDQCQKCITEMYEFFCLSITSQDSNVCIYFLHYYVNYLSNSLLRPELILCYVRMTYRRDAA